MIKRIIPPPQTQVCTYIPVYDLRMNFTEDNSGLKKQGR